MIMAVSYRLVLFAALLVSPGFAAEVAQQPQSKVRRPHDMRPVIAAFGDSLSAGLGVAPGLSYPDDLQRLIDAAGYRYRVVNLGVSGDTTTDGLVRLPSVLALHPALVVLEFGANDGLRGQPVGITERNLAHTIEALQGAGARVVLAGITLPPNYGQVYLDKFNAIFPRLAAKYKTPLIPFLLEGVAGHSDLMQPDGLHPNALGARLVAKTVRKTVTPLLEKRP